MTSPARPTLRRELGRWDLTAIGVNQVIGAEHLRAARYRRPASRRLELDRGLRGRPVRDVDRVVLRRSRQPVRRDRRRVPVYAQAFGRFVGVRSRLDAVRDAHGQLGVGRERVWRMRSRTTGPSFAAAQAARILISTVIISITALNIRGIRQSALVVNILTIAKLSPLVVFIVLGLPHISFDALRPDNAVTLEQVVDRGAAADLRLRRLRGHSGPGGRDPRSGAGGAVRDDRDPRHRRARHDAHSSGGARHACRDWRCRRRRWPMRPRCSSVAGPRS